MQQYRGSEAHFKKWEKVKGRGTFWDSWEHWGCRDRWLPECSVEQVQKKLGGATTKWVEFSGELKKQ